MGPGRAVAAGLPPEPSQHQRQPADGVAHQGHGQRSQAQSGEHGHERHVPLVGAVEHVDETPRPRLLVRVGAHLEARQHGHAQRCQPDGRQAALGPGLGHQARVQQRPGDAQAAFGRHGAAQEERAQSEEHHAAAQELAHRVRGVQVRLRVRQVEPENQSAQNDVAQEVGGDQGGGEQQEGGLSAPALPVVGADQDEEGHDVGDYAQRHG